MYVLKKPLRLIESRIIRDYPSEENFETEVRQIDSEDQLHRSTDRDCRHPLRGLDRIGSDPEEGLPTPLISRLSTESEVAPGIAAQRSPIGPVSNRTKAKFWGKQRIFLAYISCAIYIVNTVNTTNDIESSDGSGASSGLTLAERSGPTPPVHHRGCARSGK